MISIFLFGLWNQSHNFKVMLYKTLNILVREVQVKSQAE